MDCTRGVLVATAFGDPVSADKPGGVEDGGGEIVVPELSHNALARSACCQKVPPGIAVKLF